MAYACWAAAAKRTEIDLSIFIINKKKLVKKVIGARITY